MIIITEQVYETTRENISNRLITIITIIKKNILKYEKNISNINGLNLFISFSILFLTPTTISSSIPYDYYHLYFFYLIVL